MIGQFLLEILIEAPVRATGYAILRIAGRRPQIDDAMVAIVGFFFWVAVLAGVVIYLAE